MIRAWQSHAAGGPECLRLETIEIRSPGPDEITLSVRAVALNFPDTLLLRDLYQMRPQRPFAPGSECAGVVTAVGSNVGGLRLGDHAIGLGAYGLLAEQVVLNQQACVRIEPDTDMVEAAALVVTYATALYALSTIASLRRADRLLVLGAAGGVGLAAVQIGRHIGLDIVAAVSGEEKAKQARRAGADRTVIYPRDMDRNAARALTREFKAKAAPGPSDTGYDAILDPVGGLYSESAFRAIAWGGRHLVVGFPAGIPSLALNLPLVKGASIHGVFYGDFTRRQPADARACVETVLRWHADGIVRPVIGSVVPFGQAPEALAAMERREAWGKCVIMIGERRRMGLSGRAL